MPGSERPNEIVYGSDEWNAASAVTSDYQGTIDNIRTGRKEVSFKLADRWDGWYNNLMVICFGLGGALIPIGTTIHFTLSVGVILFWAGSGLLLANGLYILVLRKITLENDGNRAINMGYEIEYYSMVARNRVQDVLLNKTFNNNEYEAARSKIYEITTEELTKSYRHTRKIDIHMDIMTLALIISFGLLISSAISSVDWLVFGSILAGLLIIVLVVVFVFRARAPKSAIIERDRWLQKIDDERGKSQSVARDSEVTRK